MTIRRICGLTFAALAMGILVVIALGNLSAQVSAQRPSLQGVWRIAGVTYADPSEPPSTDGQPSQVIYTKSHYSYVAINGRGPRPELGRPQMPGKPTDAEKIATYEHWRRVTAHSGTYEVRDGVLSTHPIVAKNERVMSERGVEQFVVKIEADTLWLESKANGYTLKLVRVE